MKILFAILNYHQHNLLINLLNNINNQNIKNDIDIYIGDIQPNKEEKNKINQYIDYNNEININYFELDSNDGYAKGNNKIIKKAMERNKYEYVVISNPDIEINDKKLIQQLIYEASNKEDCAIIAPKIITHEGRQQGPYVRQHPLIYSLKYIFPMIWLPFWKYREKKITQYSELIKVWRVIGAFMIIKVKDFEKVGFFDEGTFLYWEEDILSYKLQNENKNVYFYPKIFVKHLHGSQGKSMISKFDTESMKYYFNICGYNKYLIMLCEASIKIYNFYLKILHKK